MQGVTGTADEVVVGFWDLGPSGARERIGVRGLERVAIDDEATVEGVDGHAFIGRASMPVTAGLDVLTDPVDIVYTWVDSADPAWQESRRSWIDTTSVEATHALHPARFRSHDELRYSLRSVNAYLPWVHHVYVVTAGQRPSWLGEHEWVTVVDHRDLLPPEALPTFNSHAIEANLHRIDGLAEHFVYFNDDFFVARPLAKETFFTSNGLMRVFESVARIEVKKQSFSASDQAADNGRALILAAFGRRTQYKLEHAPYPLRVSVMAAAADRWSGRIEATTASRFRHSDDVSVASGLAQHLALSTGFAVFGDLDVGYVDLQHPRLQWFLDAFAATTDFDTWCVNDTDRPRPGVADAGRRLDCFLRSRFPEAAPWER